MKLRSLIITLLLALPLLASAIETPVITFNHRLRIETWDNATNLDDATGNPTTYTRQRSTLGVRWALAPYWELCAKLTHEFRYYISPKATPFNKQEVVFDNLYAWWNKPAGLPMTIMAGRFNMWFGEGFVIADQSPLDGSRTGYFNAIKADVQVNPTGTASAFYCRMDTKDRALPIINNQHQAMADRTEEGGGLYWQQKMGVHAFHLYYLHLDQKKISTLSHYETNTFGWRYEWKYSNGIYFTTENTGQWRGKEIEEKKSFGGFLKVGRDLPAPILSLNKAEAGAIYLTENWNPLWGRWPKWSESFIYTLAREYGVANWKNLTSIFAHAVLVPSPESKIQLTYHRLGAVGYVTGGSTRGDLFIARYDYKINPRLNGCFIAERFIPGSFYVDGSNSYVWLRSELFYTFDLKM